RTINPDTLIRNLAELHPGQPVVHLEHGVGRYAGMTTLEAGALDQHRDFQSVTGYRPGSVLRWSRYHRY
ncbi:hypothetical protein EOL32_30195, partial [Citrobacter freundii]